MKGSMMQVPLTVPRLLERAAALFARKPVVTATEDGILRTTWGDVHRRARKVSAALGGLGVQRGARVASLAWNSSRHLELYFGVPASGSVLLTVNVRLSVDQVSRILAHAEADVVFADPEFTGLVDEATQSLPHGIRHKVVLGDEAQRGWTHYEGLLAGHVGVDPVADLGEEEAAGLCYTSGTTGEPKGVLYSHRAITLHTLGICLPDGFGLSERDVILPAVPMFHANAWGLAHAAAMTGATLVLPGSRPTPGRIAALLESEGVTFAAGVPTVWMGVLDDLRAASRRLAPGLRIHSGGAPTAPALLEAYRRELNVEILTGWGMTELTPVGMVTHPRGDMAEWGPEELLPVRTSQGTPLPLVDVRVVDEGGSPVPWDGATPGELEVRGPWVTAGYFRNDTTDAFRDGWLRTGDVATRDEHGYVRLVDRTKDLIRSGGEWISSVQLEHALMDHPDVAEVAVVAVPDPRWQERPWACVVRRPGAFPEPEAILGPLALRFPKWWVPDRVVFVDAVPRTSTGKFDKKALRAWLREGLPGDGGRELP
ncbi:MAG TPA: long-chain fatty acid--CoA ligase [Longimicrobiales bacterium]|nr:long-chain fatty acid--CoA ligase [Longimicrobiales bacterium]